MTTLTLLQGGTVEVGSLTSWTLWVTTVLMGVGAAAIVARGRGLTSEEGVRHTVISALVPAIAMAMYLGMATGIGIVSISVAGDPASGAQTVFWMRYTDWVVTTPLLLLGLALVAGADRTTIGLLLGLDVYMIVTGLIGGYTAVQTYRYLWWLVSTGAFVTLVYLLVGPVTRAAARQSSTRTSGFERLRNLLLGVWVFYPFVWLLGPEVVGVIPVGVETVVYAVLDLTAKVGFGLLTLGVVDSLDTSDRRSRTTGAAAVDD